MKIRIAENIDDPFLKSEWERLEQEGDVFPQSTYHWCATWWKHLSGKRKLHVVMAVDEEGEALGIAPLCIERHFGVRVLRSFPIHFGDFYTFITADNKNSKRTISRIVEYMNSNTLWRWSRLEQVAESSDLVRVLSEGCFRRKRMTTCMIADFSGLEWDEYLAKLRMNFRGEVRRRTRKINEKFAVELGVIHNWKKYEKEFDEMVRIHRERWRDDNTPAKGTVELACLMKSIQGQFLKGTMVYYQLLFDNITVAYSLGFLVRGTFYAWHASFDPRYRKYHVGVMIMVFMIRHFMETGVSRINFMAGDHAWKLNWSPDRRVEFNYMFTSPSNGPAAAFLNWYHHRVRDRLKAAYHKMMQVRALRAVSRGVILVRQKLAGLR